MRRSSNSQSLVSVRIHLLQAAAYQICRIDLVNRFQRSLVNLAYAFARYRWKLKVMIELWFATTLQGSTLDR
jgi:hypothetical protein